MMDQFRYIGVKVCQSLLHYISFATRGQTCVKENWPLTKWGHKISVCIILSCLTISSNGNHLIILNGALQILSSMSSYVIIERLVAPVV